MVSPMGQQLPASNPSLLPSRFRPAAGYALFFAYALNAVYLLVSSSVLATGLLASYPAWHAWHRFGRRRALAFAAIVLPVTWAVEAAGVRWGWVFGRYHYTALLGPQLLGVPAFIPVAWAVVLYLSHGLADAILGPLDARALRTRRGLPHAMSSIARRAALGALAATAWDVGMDPLLSHGGMWVWLDGGAYFGVPLQNFAGWLSTSFVVLVAFELISAFLPAPTGDGVPPRVPPDGWFVALPVLAYAFQIALLLRAYLGIHWIVPCIVSVLATSAFVLAAAVAMLRRSFKNAAPAIAGKLARGLPPTTARRLASAPAWFLRLRDAFSPQRNLRSMLVPDASRWPQLDGIRALSILWVVVFHSAWYSIGRIPASTGQRLLDSPWMVPVWRGDFAVDVFFVLSGFLIAGMLMDEHDAHGGVSLRLFYVRRLMRLWPALIVAVAIDVALGDPNARASWATLLYVGNFIPAAFAAMPWTWSLAIEEQFYLACPWLLRGTASLRPASRVAVVIGTATAFALLAAAIVAAAGLTAHDAEIAIDRPVQRWLLAADVFYVKPWMRAGPLLAGVASAILARTPGLVRSLSERRLSGTIGLAAALVVAAVMTHWPLAEHLPRGLEIAYVASFRTLFGACVAFVLLMSLSKHPVGSALGRPLSSRILYPFSQLAYSAYLLNPLVAVSLRGILGPAVAGMRNPLLVLTPLDMACTFAAAAVLHLAVERPFMRLRPRAARPHQPQPESNPPEAVVVPS